MFDMYPKLIAHRVHKNLADRIDRLTIFLLDHVEFFEFKETRRSASKAAKALSDQAQMIFDTLNR